MVKLHFETLKNQMEKELGRVMMIEPSSTRENQYTHTQYLYHLLIATLQETLISTALKACPDNLALLHPDLLPRTDHAVMLQQEHIQHSTATLHSNVGISRTCILVPYTSLQSLHFPTHILPNQDASSALTFLSVLPLPDFWQT